MTTKTRGPRHPEGLREKIATLAAKPEGFSKAMLKPDYPISTIYNAVDWMVKHGIIFRAPINSTTVRFFDTPEAAKAYELANKKPPPLAKAKQSQHFTKGAETVYAPGYKLTVHPTPKPRFSVIEFSFQHGHMRAL